MPDEKPTHAGCGGELARHLDGFKCEGCGQEWVTNPEKHQFYELHREQIHADIVSLKEAGARKKWGIPSGTFSNMLKNWAAAEPPPGPEKEPPAPGPAAEKSRDGHVLVPQGDPQKLFTITDHDLIRLPDEDYQAAWQILGKIIRARCRQN